MSYSNYPELKDSGIEWLGEIPAHWEVMRLKNLGSIKYGLGQPPSQLDEGLPLLRATNIERGRITPKGLMFINPEEVPYDRDPILRTNDIVVVRSGAYTGDSAIIPSEYDGAIAGYDMVVRVAKAQPRFIAYGLLSIPVLNNQIDLFRMRAAQPHLNAEELGECLFFIPSEEEQQTIAAFLDSKTAELDELIRLKERQIELLGAKRQSLISHAVTRGLDPSVKMCPSGIEWLGDIPAHWELLRLKFSLRSIEQGWSPSCENRMAEPDEWGVLKVGCVNGISFNQSENKALPSNLEPLIEYEIKDGEVLMSRANTRELLGSASVVENVRRRLLLCDKLYRLKLNTGTLNNHFLVFSLGASVARHQIERDATGASDSMQNIGQDTVRNLWLPTPPLEEQAVIVDHIRFETLRIDLAIKTIRAQIDQLREYRQALISAAVTGKIDVRGESV